MRSQSRWCWVLALVPLLAGVSGVAAQDLQTGNLSSSTLPTPEQWNRVTLLVNSLLTHSATLETQVERSNEQLGITQEELAIALRRLNEEHERSLGLEQLVGSLNRQLAASERSRANLQQSRDREREASQAQEDYLTAELEASRRQVGRLSRGRWFWFAVGAVAGVIGGGLLL